MHDTVAAHRLISYAYERFSCSLFPFVLCRMHVFFSSYGRECILALTERVRRQQEQLQQQVEAPD